MNTKTLLTVKTDKNLKQAAKKTAEELGFSLGTLINAFLKQFVRNKEVTFYLEYRPNKKLIEIIRKGDKEYVEGRLPKPMTLDELMAHLNF